ncbi:hypothetical protein Tco_0917055 [Tanacetum coccineum]
MVKLSFDLNVRKDSSDTDEVEQKGGNPKSVTFEIHHGRCFTPTPSRSYVGGQMAKYVKDNKIILVYVEHGSSNVDSSIFITPKKGVAIAADNHVRKAPIKIDSSPDVNRNLTPMCHRNLTKERKHVSSKALSIDEVIKNLSDYANTREEITREEIIREEIIGKQMIVHVGNSSTVDDVLDYEMIFEIEGVGHIGKFKYVEVDVDNESEEESDTKENDTSGSDSEDLDYDPKHDEEFDDDEHILKEVPVSMNNFNFNPNPKHDLSIGYVEVQEHDLDVIDYDSFGSDLDDEIDFNGELNLEN